MRAKNRVTDFTWICMMDRMGTDVLSDSLCGINYEKCEKHEKGMGQVFCRILCSANF